jgi:hypothetical protein
MADKCIACGMPMETSTDHASGDPGKAYCRHCARPDGSMQSYPEKLDSMTRFIMQSEGRQEAPAREKATKWLAQQPAWQQPGS